MKRIHYKNVAFATLSAACFLFAGCNSTASDTPFDYARYVDPFIGTQGTGHTYPGACYPFGLVQASPETNATGWQHCSGYQYTDSLIWGFSQTHLNGTGCIDLGDILLQPIAGKRIKEDYRSTYDKASETASPGYYSVALSNPTIQAEMTATSHVAFYRFSYADADTTSLLVDLQHGLTWNDNGYYGHVVSCDMQQQDEHTITGQSVRREWAIRNIAFTIRFNRPIQEIVKLPVRDERERGERWVVTFEQNDEPLMAQVAIAPTTVEDATANLQKECDTWDFEAVRTETREAWNRQLACATAEGTKEQLQNFYTPLYHLMQQPNALSDSTFSTFSLWDTYRAAHPLYTILKPGKAALFVNSIIAHGERSPYLPIWALWGYDTHCMIGNHAVPVIVDAILKGLPGIDAERAFSVIKKTLTTPHDKSEWDIYDQYGYFPADLIATESVSRTLEACTDDYAAALLAEKLGKTEDAAFFRKRANYYRNLFDSTTHFMRPRLSDGSWKAPFDPTQLAHAESIGGDYTEGNAWQYTWHVQHDAQGLMELFPSRDAFLQRLDGLFTAPASQGTLSDVTGLIGQYAHGNEPSHHVSYLYTVAGKPERTQELVRQIIDTQYRNKPDGLCGNDDCGQMSAWYLFSVMGFYPLNPVGGEYILGAPQLPRITLHLENGKTFSIIAEGLSTENKYVQSVTLNGQPLAGYTITHEQIMAGGELRFLCGAKR